MHSVAVLSHSPLQVPAVGPDELPAMHVLLPEHQPQPASIAHAEHVVAAPQPPVLHEPVVHAQSPHEPELGPPDVPAMHPPPLLHQPHPAWIVHSPQLAYPHTVAGGWHVPL